MNNRLLKLSAADEEDINIISAMLQDAIVPMCDMLYTPEENKFIIVMHRFRWDDTDNSSSEIACFERVHCALEVENVEKVQHQGFDKISHCGMLELLALILDGIWLRLVFAGGAEIRLKLSEGWRLQIRDFGEPWPCVLRPSHPA